VNRRTPLVAAISIVLGAPGIAAASPSTGDWEAGNAAGALASFAVYRAGGHSLAVHDLVVQAPIRCRNASVSPLRSMLR